MDSPTPQLPFKDRVSSLRREEDRAIRDRDYETIENLSSRWEELAERRMGETREDAHGDPEKETFLVTGGAGFIGSHLSARLAEMGHPVIIVDNYNDYYNPVFKYRNLERLFGSSLVTAFDVDFRDIDSLERVFRRRQIDQIVHLGARAGVRPSLEDPQLYVTTNVLGTQNLLEMARRHGVKNYIYASSSSVYGGSTEFPYSETQRADSPISPYAATKRSSEIQAACYHNLYRFPVTGLRFFTAYGPYGRPDMAYRKFVELIDRGCPIPMYGDGDTERDYTYIDDIIDGVIRAIEVSRSKENWNEIFNLGESETTTLRRFVLLIASYLHKIDPEKPVEKMTPDEERKWLDVLTQRGLVKRLPEQLGDVPKTYADVEKSRRLLGYRPRISLAEGLLRFVEWYRSEKRREEGSQDSAYWASVGEYNRIKLRLAPDSLNRINDPEYTSADLDRLREIRDTFAAADQGNHAFLSAWLLANCARLLGEIAACLPGKDGRRPWGLTGLLLHRKRMNQSPSV
jgi:UDP-glucuronate 4-epimerase